MSAKELGVVVGRARTLSFTFRSEVRPPVGAFIIAEDKETGARVLGVVKEVTMTGAIALCDVDVLGEIKGKRLQEPKKPVTPGSKVYWPDAKELSEILLGGYKGEKLWIGRLLTHPEMCPVYFPVEDIARHVLLTASTGGGKSYTVAVLIEELLRVFEGRKDAPAVLVVDAHNEYGGLALPNKDPEQCEMLKQWGLSPRGFADRLIIFDWKYNPPRISRKFDAQRFAFLFSAKDYKWFFYIQEILAQRKKEKMDVEEMINEVLASDLHPSTKQAIVRRLRSILHSGILSEEEVELEDFIRPGHVTIIRLADTPLGDVGMRFVVADILRRLYDAAKARRLKTKVIIVVEEAHLFAPAKGQYDPVREIIERISREGRKLGLWLILVTQSPRDLSPTVITNLNSFLALRLQRRDVRVLIDYLGASKELAEVLVKLQPGQGYLRTPSLLLPVLVQVRPRLTCEAKGPYLREVEEIVRKIAEKTRIELEQRIKARMKPKAPPVPPPKPEVKPAPPKPTAVVRPPQPQVQREQVRQAEALAPPKVVVTRPTKPTVPRQPPLDIERVVSKFWDEVSALGPAAVCLVQELVLSDGELLLEYLAGYDESVVDALLASRVIKLDGNVVRLNREYFERLVGRIDDATWAEILRKLRSLIS